MALVRFLADPTSDLRAAAFMRSRFVRLSDGALTRLGPRLARALVGGLRPTAAPHDDEPTGEDGLDAEDRRVLAKVREALPQWLALVDRITPAELLDRVLTDAAYAFETRGARRAQARENLKKL